jgi:hypothetical protein
VEDVEEIVQFVKKVMLEVGSHGPTIFLKGSEGKVAVALASFGENVDKRINDMLNAGTFTALKHSVGELELIIFVSEAWMGRASNGEEFIRPSLDPKRIEVLMVTYLDTATKEQKMISIEIVRNKQEKVIDLKEMSMPEVDRIESPLLSAFLKGYQLIRPVTN